MADVTQSIDVRIQTAIDASNSAKTLAELKASMRDLNSLALEAGDTQSEAYLKAATAAGQAKDKIIDLRAQTNALAGSKLEGLSNSLNLVGSSVATLDFGAATSGLKGFTTTLKSFSFAELATEIKALAVAFGELAIAILANPITWIAAAIVAVIAATGKLGAVFSGIKNTLSDIKDIWNDFTDSLGITTNALEKTAAQAKLLTDELSRSYEYSIKIAEAFGGSTLTLQYQKLQNDIKGANDELLLLFKTQDKLKGLSEESMKRIIDSGHMFETDLLARGIKAGDELRTKLSEGFKKIADAKNALDVFLAKTDTDYLNTLLKTENLKTEVINASIKNKEKKEIALLKQNIQIAKQEQTILENQLREDKKRAIDQQKLLNINSEEYRNYGLIITNIDQRIAEGKQKVKKVIVETNESIIKVRQKYRTEELANINKNLRTEYDLITSSATLTEEEKYNLHTQNLYKQEEATKNYYDKLIKNAVGNKEEIKQLETEKAQAVQALVDKNWAVYSEYYNKINDAGLKEVKDKEDNNKKILENEKNLNQELLNLKLQHLQNIQSIDEMELANLRTKHNKSFSAERDLIRKINADKNAVYAEQKAKEIKEENIKYEEQIKLAGLNNDLKEQLETQHKVVLADIEAKFNANVKQNNIETNELIKQNKLDSVQRYIEMTQYGADAMNSIFDLLNTADEERVKRGEMSAKDAKTKAFKRSKATGIATATINTAMAITQALGTLPPPYSFIAAGLAGAAGLAQILKISTMTEPADTSSSGGSVATPTSPDFGTAPSSNTSSMFNASAFYGVGTQRTEESTRHREAQRVYVVESDITSTQKRVEVQAQRGTLSGV